MKKIGWAILLLACCIGGFLALPSNYYLRRALTHFLPKIDQYPIFENRIVKATRLPGNRRRHTTLVRFRRSIFRSLTG